MPRLVAATVAGRRDALSARFWKLAGAVVVAAVWSTPAHAQVTPAAGYTPPDDTPSIRVGATIFADYTITEKPKGTDIDGNTFTPSSFNIGRAYINVTGNISHRIAFRITPDIVREGGTGSTLNGSYTFRLKYAFLQFNLDDWMTRGSWVRLGMQQTPWVDFEETVYRYRFQGPVFADREAYLSSSDVGASFHYNFARNWGDVHAGFYNGETYSRQETNDQKAFMVRGTFRPFRQHPIMRGLRVSGFFDGDAYVQEAERRRGIVALTFEHPHVNAAVEYLDVEDQTRAAVVAVDGHGYSLWVTPRATNGWEGLFRFDHLEPNTDAPGTRDRTIAGVAYWFPHQGNVATALLFDMENVNNNDFAPSRPDERRWAVHALVNF
jgi:phosphate-selective porin O/P